MNNIDRGNIKTNYFREVNTFFLDIDQQIPCR